MNKRDQLLPHPQSIHLGSGFFSLVGAAVIIGRSSSREDSFAADELMHAIAQQTGIKLQVDASSESKRTILLSRTGDVDTLPVPGEQTGPESREGYQIKITSDSVNVTARSSAGLHYGVQTLCQLVEGSGEEAALPEVEIDDWPTLAYRGVMMDISHGALPTENELKYYIDFLAKWRTNQLYLYSEASIELDGYSLVNHGARLTKAEVRRVVAYGAERHVDVILHADLYGHMHDLLRIEKYSGLGWRPHGPELDPANADQKQLLDDWIDQFAELFPSPFVHIGLDEVWEIEVAAAKIPGMTPGTLFADQLNYIADRFRTHGKITVAYADMVVKYPEVFDSLPKDLIGVAWDYDAVPDSSKFLYPLSENKLSHFIQTGVANWLQLTLDYDLTLTNVDNFLAEGRKSGAIGLIHSVWADSAQALVRLAFPSIAYGMIAAWQPTQVRRDSFFLDYAFLMYPRESAPDVASALDAMNMSELALKACVGTRTVFEVWADPFAESRMQKAREHMEDLRKARLFAEDALEHLFQAIALGTDRKTLDCLIVGARQLDYAAYRLMVACETEDLWNALGAHPTAYQMWVDFESAVASHAHSLFLDLMEQITELKEDYRKEWLEEYAPYRLGVALGRWDAEYEFWRNAHQKLREFLYEFDYQKNALPPLRSLIR